MPARDAANSPQADPLAEFQRFGAEVGQSRSWLQPHPDPRPRPAPAVDDAEVARGWTELRSAALALRATIGEQEGFAAGAASQLDEMLHDAPAMDRDHLWESFWGLYDALEWLVDELHGDGGAACQRARQALDEWRRLRATAR